MAYVPTSTYARFQCGGCGETEQEVYCMVHVTHDGPTLEVNERMGECPECDDPNWTLIDRGF